MKKYIIIFLISALLITPFYLLIHDKTFVRTNVNKIDLNKVDNLMIIAHPDDETIWGGDHLIKENYLVVCITCGRSKTRNHEIKEALKISNDQLIMLAYPDKTFGKKHEWKKQKKQIAKDLEKIIKVKNFKQIVTHNPNGEYGHIHHRIISSVVTKITTENILSDKLYYFGKYYTKEKIKNKHLTKIDNKKTKNQMINIYKSQSFIKDYFSQMFEFENFIPYQEWE